MNTIKLIITAALVLAIGTSVLSAQQQEMTKEQWQKQVTELTAKRNDLKNTYDGLQKEVADLRKQDAEKDAALKQCQDEFAALQGQQETPFKALSDNIDSKLSELSRLSNQDLYARRAELDSIQAWINAEKQNPLSAIKKNEEKLNELQARLDALKKSLEQVIASGQAVQTYKVGTWAKDRDCLWNIAKKPKIYDNAFLWPKIWQGNRDQIKNPDVIHKGQVLKIPQKADLTKAEKSALKRYWAKKNSVATAPAAKP
jgi:peptidoglycan hydrolase CwlO-like protein